MMSLPGPPLAEGPPSWFTDELKRCDAAAAAIKRALPSALKAARDGRTLAPVELYDPIRHHGLEQRELIQVQAGDTLERALWPGLYLGSTIAAVVGWILLIRSGTQRFLWSPILSQLIAIICGQIWASRIRERFRMEVLGLSGVSREEGDEVAILSFLRTSSDLWRFIRVSAQRQPVAEGIVFYGAHAAALLGALGWSASLLSPGMASLPWGAMLGCAFVEGALVLWLGFLSVAGRALDQAKYAINTSSTATLDDAPRGDWLPSALWLTCGAILAVALMVSAFKVRDQVSTRLPPRPLPSQLLAPPIIGVDYVGDADPLLLASGDAMAGPLSLFKNNGPNGEVRYVPGSMERLNDCDRLLGKFSPN